MAQVIPEGELSSPEHEGDTPFGAFTPQGKAAEVRVFAQQAAIRLVAAATASHCSGPLIRRRVGRDWSAGMPAKQPSAHS